MATTEETYKAAREQAKCYRENQPEYAVRIRNFREVIQAEEDFHQTCSRCGQVISMYKYVGNYQTTYTLSEGATLSPGGQIIKCSFDNAEFFLKSYGVTLPYGITLKGN